MSRFARGPYRVTAFSMHQPVGRWFQGRCGRLTGIGRRLDGWLNLDLQVGAIAAPAPGFPDGLREEFRNWGPGKYNTFFSLGLTDEQKADLVAFLKSL